MKRDIKKHYCSACLNGNGRPIVVVSDHHLCSRNLEAVSIIHQLGLNTNHLRQQDIIENLGWMGRLSQKGVNNNVLISLGNRTNKTLKRARNGHSWILIRHDINIP